jgi:hypothetical protein
VGAERGKGGREVEMEGLGVACGKIGWSGWRCVSTTTKMYVYTKVWCGALGDVVVLRSNERYFWLIVWSWEVFIVFIYERGSCLEIDAPTLVGLAW